MFALDLFNTKYEKELHEGAVDNLEARRIEDLNDSMDYMIKAYKQADSDEVRAAIKRRYEEFKAERDSYYKIKDECMGYGTLGETGLPDVADKQAKMAQLNQPNKAGTDLVSPQQRVAGATPPSNTTVGKAKSTFASFANWLAGGPDTGPTYETAVREQVASAISPVTAAKYAYEQMRKAYDENRDIATIQWMNNAIPITMSRNQLYHTMTKLQGMSRQNRNQFALQTLANRDNFALWLGAQKKVATRPTLKQPADPFQPNLTGYAEPKVGTVSERAQKKNSEKEVAPQSPEVQRYLTKVRRQSPNATSDLEAIAKDELEKQARVNKNIDDLEAVNARQDAALKKAMTLDRRQDTDLEDIENQINQLQDRFQTIKTAKPSSTATTTTPSTPTPTVGATTAKKKPEARAKTVAQGPPAQEPQARAEPEKQAEPEEKPTLAPVDPKIEKKIQGLETLLGKLEREQQNDPTADIEKKIADVENRLKSLADLETARINALPAQAAQALNLEPGDSQGAKQTKRAPRVRAPLGDLDIEPAKTKSAKQKFPPKPVKSKARVKPKKAAPAATADDDFDVLGLDNPNANLDPAELAAFDESTGDQFGQAVQQANRTGKQLQQDPAVRRIKQQKDYELMLKKELANRIQDRDESDDEQDFQDVTESNMKRLEDNLAKMSDEEFQTRYGKNKAYWRNRIRANLAPVTNTNINDLESDIDTAQTRPSFDRTGRVVRQKPANTQQGMRRMLGRPKATRPAAELNPVEVTMQVPNRKTDRYDLLPARIFNSEAEAREFARRVNGNITSIRPVMHEDSTQNQRLHAGDPIIVTAPNEFEGATGEIYELSPSGSFVIVDLYNHGKHSMHLSDVEFNQYAAADEDEDDWYDDEEVDEGFQDFNRVEPYAVCLAGKPVKKFDYYEEARRFHDNWKKKLYREGDKAKADKITLMPLNLDEEEQKPYNPNEFRPVGPITIVPPKKLKSGETHQGINDYWKAHGQAPIYKTNEAGNPAQQAAIAISKKKQVSEFAPSNGDNGDNFDPDLAAMAKQEGVVKGYSLVDHATIEKALQIPHCQWGDMYDGQYKQYFVKGFMDGRKAKLEQARKDGVELSLQKDGSLSRVQQAVAEGSGDLKSELAAVYSELAPKIERHRDSFGAGQLYDALEAVADKHGAGKQLAIMMRSARNSAHMEYDTNPGGFENWFWFLPFATDDEQGVVEGELREDAIPAKMVMQGFVVEYNPSTRTVVISKRGQELEKYRYNGQASLLSFQRNVGHRIKALEDDLYGGDDEAGAVSLSRVKVPGRGYGYQELGEDDSSTSSDEAESAILKRIMVAHLDLLKEGGPEKVMQAVEEVAYNIGDLDEIGSSDVSGWVHQVRDILGVPEPDQEEFLDEKWSTKYKRSIDCNHPKGFSQRAHCAGRKK
jgi:hypothetical protein